MCNILSVTVPPTAVSVTLARRTSSGDRYVCEIVTFWTSHVLIVDVDSLVGFLLSEFVYNWKRDHLKVLLLLRAQTLFMCVTQRSTAEVPNEIYSNLAPNTDCKNGFMTHQTAYHHHKKGDGPGVVQLTNSKNFGKNWHENRDHKITNSIIP